MSAPTAPASFKKRFLGNRVLRGLAVTAYVAFIAIRLAAIRLVCGKRLLLLFRAGGLGDIIATLPAVAALRKQYPERHLVFCTRPDFTGIAPLLSTVDRVLGVFHGDTIASVLSRWVDARRFHYPDESPASRSTEHFVLEMAASVRVQLEPGATPHLAVEPMTDTEFAALFPAAPAARRIIALHAGPTAPVKEWPQASWQTLCDSLQQQGDAVVVQIGVGAHFLHGSRDVSLHGAHRSQRPLSLLESARLLRRAELMIGVDSGPLHLAAAVGTPCLGLFGPVDPRLRAPATARAMLATPRLDCQFCHHVIPRGHWETGCPHGIACLERLTPGQVATAAHEILRSPHQAPAIHPAVLPR